MSKNEAPAEVKPDAVADALAVIQADRERRAKEFTAIMEEASNRLKCRIDLQVQLHGLQIVPNIVVIAE